MVKNYKGIKIQMVTLGDRVENTKYGQQRYLGQCDCGNRRVFAVADLRSGNTKSCGCFRRETCGITGKKNITHGATKTVEFVVWQQMKERCYNKNRRDYKNYGGRGIKVHKLWKNSYGAFQTWLLSDIGLRPSSAHSIDRIDNDGNYEPGNLRWATKREQVLNRRKRNVR